MIATVLLAAGLAAGLGVRRLALLAAAIHLPVAAAALIGAHWLRARPDNSHRASMLCEGVAAELRGGATLRDALVDSARSVGIDPGASLAPLDEVAQSLAVELPSIGPEIQLTVATAMRSGSDTAALFDEMGSLALAQEEVRREVSMATAPGRATALLLIGAPVLFLLTRFDDGGLGTLLLTAEQRIAAVIGLGLFVVGLAGACLVLWRAGR